MGLYIQGQMGNTIFRSFYIMINKINQTIDITVQSNISENKTASLRLDIM